LALSLFAIDVWVTEVDPAVVGEEVLFVSCFTTLVPPAVAGLLAASRNANDGVELPVPIEGTVVLVTGLTVVLVVGSVLVLGAVPVVGATVVLTGTLVTVAPWTPAEAGASAGGVAGAASADAGPEPRSRKSPARSAKDAAHRRGLTTSIFGLALICPDYGLSWACLWLGTRRAKRLRRDKGFLT